MRRGDAAAPESLPRSSPRADDGFSSLVRGLPVFGTLQTIGCAELTRVALECNYDFIILDCERNAFDSSCLRACLAVIANTRTFGVVRVPCGDLLAVERYAQLGAQAILMPHVCTGPQAEAFVDTAVRACQNGEYPKPLLLALIEDVEAIVNVEAISATPGLGGLIIGPKDLACDLGIEEDFHSPAYVSAFSQVQQAAQHRRLLLGTRVHPPFTLPRLLAAGHTFILASSDMSALAEGYRLHLSAARGCACDGAGREMSNP